LLTSRPEYRPQCLRDLIRLLGYSDSTIEWSEVAIRHLRAERQAGGEERLRELARAYAMHVNPIDLDGVAVRMASLHIVAVQQWVEWFLDEFKREHPRHTRDKKSGEDSLAFILSAFNITSNAVGQIECEILEYYRLVRNHLVHNPTAAQRKVHERQGEKIRTRLPSSPFAKLSAPNPIEALRFDDFVLFTWAAKRFARNLCRHSTPSVDDIFLVLTGDAPLLKSLRGVKQNTDRLEQKLATYLRTRFALVTTAESFSRELLKKGLLAQ
jgi:hypothetical protein